MYLHYRVSLWRLRSISEGIYPVQKPTLSNKYTRSVWELGLSVRHICFNAAMEQIGHAHDLNLNRYGYNIC